MLLHINISFTADAIILSVVLRHACMDGETDSDKMSHNICWLLFQHYNNIPAYWCSACGSSVESREHVGTQYHWHYPPQHKPRPTTLWYQCEPLQQGHRLSCCWNILSKEKLVYYHKYHELILDCDTNLYPFNALPLIFLLFSLQHQLNEELL